MQMLGQFVNATKPVIPLKFTQLCEAAMYMLAFLEFLIITIRAGVLVEHVIQRSDLEIVPEHNGLNKTSLRLTIRHAKHHQVSRPIVLEITPKSWTCPVAYIFRYLHSRGSPAGPVFIFADKNIFRISTVSMSFTSRLRPWS